jgi:hypothetical protein
MKPFHPGLWDRSRFGARLSGMLENWRLHF